MLINYRTMFIVIIMAVALRPSGMMINYVQLLDRFQINQGQCLANVYR